MSSSVTVYKIYSPAEAVAVLDFSSRDLASPTVKEIPVLDLGAWSLKSTDGSKNSSLGVTHLLRQQQPLLRMLKDRAQEFALMVASPEECAIAGKYATHLYLPGEICRQADVLEAASVTGCRIVLEKGAFLSPQDLCLALPKLKNSDVTLIDAGSFYGYSDRVLDPRSLMILQNTGLPFGIHLSELLGPEGLSYTWKTQWTHANDFLSCFVKTALAFEATVFVYRAQRGNSLDKGALSQNSIQNLLPYFEKSQIIAKR